MHPSIYRDFALSTVRTVETEAVEADRRRRYGLLHVTMLHTGTQRSYSFEVRSGVCDVDRCVEDAVLKHFPDSKAAADVRYARGLTDCRLKSGWSESLGEALHTGLRKLCDSSASAFWWNLAHDLPRPIWNQLLERSRATLETVPNPAPVIHYANALRNAWAQVLEEAHYFRFDGHHPSGPEEFTEKGWPDLSETLERKEKQTFQEKAKLAWLALDYLSTEDWMGMLGFSVDYVEEPVRFEPGI